MCKTPSVSQKGTINPIKKTKTQKAKRPTHRKIASPSDVMMSNYLILFFDGIDLVLILK